MLKHKRKNNKVCPSKTQNSLGGYEVNTNFVSQEMKIQKYQKISVYVR